MGKPMNTPKQLRKIRGEEEAAKETPGRSAGPKVDEVWKEMEDCIFLLEPEKKKIRDPERKNLADGLEHDITEFVAKVPQLGWRDGESLS